MPVFSELGPPAEIGHSKDASVLEPNIAAANEAGRQADVKTAVSGEQRGVVAVQLQSFFMEDKHGNLGAVFRRVPDLVDFVGGRIDAGGVYFVPQISFVAGEIVMIDGRWDSERLKAEEKFLAIPLAPRTGDAADGREWNVGDEFAVQLEKFEQGTGILFVLSAEFAADD